MLRDPGVPPGDQVALDLDVVDQARGAEPGGAEHDEGLAGLPRGRHVRLAPHPIG